MDFLRFGFDVVVGVLGVLFVLDIEFVGVLVVLVLLVWWNILFFDVLGQFEVCVRIVGV